MQVSASNMQFFKSAIEMHMVYIQRSLFTPGGDGGVGGGGKYIVLEKLASSPIFFRIKEDGSLFCSRET